MRPDLEAIEARANAATAGPWEVCLGSGGNLCTAIKSEGFGEEDEKFTPICDLLPDWILDVEAKAESHRSEHRPDMNFIAHARADIPSLLSYIRTLEAAAPPPSPPREEPPVQSDLREILEEIKRSVRAHMDKDAVLSPTGPTQSFRAGQIDILDQALALLSPASPLVEAALKLADELSDQISRCTDPKRAAELANATDEWGYLLTLNVRYQQARALPVPPQASTGRQE